jgi:hypothetical protein
VVVGSNYKQQHCVELLILIWYAKESWNSIIKFQTSLNSWWNRFAQSPEWDELSLLEVIIILPPPPSVPPMASNKNTSLYSLYKFQCIILPPPPSVPINGKVFFLQQRTKLNGITCMVLRINVVVVSLAILKPSLAFI